MVDYWVTLGKDNNDYFFKRSRGTTKRISEKAFIKHGQGPVEEYSVTLGVDGKYYYYKTVRGKKIRMKEEDFERKVDYLPNLYFVMTGIGRDYVDVYSNDLPDTYVYNHVPRVRIVSTGADINYYVPRPRQYFSTGESKMSCDRDYSKNSTPPGYDNIDNQHCEGPNSCTNVVTVLSTEHYTEELPIVQTLSKIGVMPPLVKHWKCKSKGYLVNRKVEGTLSSVVQRMNRDLSEPEKLKFVFKLKELVGKAHLSGITLGHNISLHCLGYSGTFPSNYNLRVVCADQSQTHVGSGRTTDFVQHMATDDQLIASFPAAFSAVNKLD